MVPEGAISGELTISSSTGEVSKNIVIAEVDRPIISRVLPKGNERGGPLMILGENINLVDQMTFGPIDLGLDKMVIQSDLLATHVPNAITISGQTVSIQLKSINACYTPAFDFVVGTSTSAQNPLSNNSVNVTIPNVPSGISLPNINNDWGVIEKFWTDEPELGLLSLGGAEVAPGDTTYLTDPNEPEDTIAIHTETGSYVEVLYKGQWYYGAQNNKYPPFNEEELLHIVLIPTESGDQIEMLNYPLIETEKSTIEGDQIVIKGRFFVGDEEVLLFDENSNSIDLQGNDFVSFINNTTLSYQLPSDLPLGTYQLVLRDYNFMVSNPFTFEIQ